MTFLGPTALERGRVDDSRRWATEALRVYDRGIERGEQQTSTSDPRPPTDLRSAPVRGWYGPSMDGFLRIILYLAGLAAMLRGLAAFDAGGSAAENYPLPSAILFIGGAFLLLRLRDADRAAPPPPA